MSEDIDLITFRKQAERFKDDLALRSLVKEFFSYLDATEESDNGNAFHPLQLTCSRATMMPKVAECLEKMKELACK